MSHSLLKVAMLGLNRATLPEKLSLMGLEPPILGEQAEARLLEAAGFQSLAKKAGFEPVKLELSAEGQKAEGESLPYISLSVQECLRQILNGNNQRLLEELLRLSREKGQIISPEYLPKLFQWLMIMKLPRSSFLPVIGKRGYWLANLREDWQVLLPPAAEAWKYGTTDQRIDWLAWMRRQGAEQARALLAAQWKQCHHKELSKMVAVLRIHLSEADEELLLQLAAHRRKEVRMPAQDLLTYLPDGHYVQRIKSYISSWLSLESGSLSVKFPETLTEDMQKDGIDQALPFSGSTIGQKGNWLARMIAMIPLPHWEKTWNCSPEACIELLTDHAWKTEIVHGWAHACLRFPNSDWALGLLRAAATEQRPLYGTIAPNVMQELIALIDPEMCSEWLAEDMLKTDQVDALVSIFSLLVGLKTELSEKTGWIFAQKLALLLHQQSQHPYPLRAMVYALSEISYVLPARLYPQISDCWMQMEGQGHWYEMHLETALQLLELRYQLNGHEPITPTR